ncbi:hypothetical protein JTB14_001944 [Gonioctena quinquepunctata]|nr:hypothetical protein JTB14_001944 [Gonioctena quinquepunctata]
MEEPKIILLVSGKRKSGKDFICEKLKSIIGKERCEIIRISGPLKKLYAQQHNLNLQELMGVGPYKEKYRLKMINWSDEVRAKNPGYFCEAACREASVKPVWIVSDVRRKTDISWFRGVYTEKVKTVRILADTDVRKTEVGSSQKALMT